MSEGNGHKEMVLAKGGKACSMARIIGTKWEGSMQDEAIGLWSLYSVWRRNRGDRS